MEYNKDLLKSWHDDCEDDLEDDDASTDEFAIMHLIHCLMINKRIAYCKKLLARYKDALVYYTLADLYNRYDFDESGRIFYKQLVRFYCIMAIRKDRNYASAWALLAQTYWWLTVIERVDASCLSFVGDEYIEDKELIMQELEDWNYDFEAMYNENQKKQIKYTEKAISYIKKAIKIEPSNNEYKNMLEYYYQERNGIYCQGGKIWVD